MTEGQVFAFISKERARVKVATEQVGSQIVVRTMPLREHTRPGSIFRT